MKISLLGFLHLIMDEKVSDSVVVAGAMGHRTVTNVCEQHSLTNDSITENRTKRKIDHFNTQHFPEQLKC